MAITSFLSANTFSEVLFDEWHQVFRIDEMLFEEITEHQDLKIFQNERYGRVLTLDGIVQLTTADEFVYHEMLVHVPLFSHPDPKHVLIIGGGDGGALREVLRHDQIESATVVDIDSSVIEMSIKYLPTVSNGAYDHPKTKVVIQDASIFIQDTEEKYDVIICDSTDPIGPAEVLFTPEFYSACYGALNKGGILVTQGGVPFVQEDELSDGYNHFKKSFEKVTFFVAPVPTYIGGFMAFGFATDGDYLPINQNEIRMWMENMPGKMKYYNPEIHLAAFALPEYVKDLLGDLETE
ncbi:MAG: polyamine aminopropyltransferase [Simkaniaceae bacterium]|nr:polyamine aminopropyltransferase [Simkaniaceae bacterium]